MNAHRPLCRAAAPLLAALLAAGCATTLRVPAAKADLLQHGVYVGHSGAPIPVVVDGDTSAARAPGVQGDEYRDRYVHEMMNGIRRDSAHRRLVFVVHGGMANPGRTLRQNDTLLRLMRAEGIHPVFINWDSGLRSSYLEYLLFVRQGERMRRWGPLTSPLVLASDLLQGVARAPLTWGSQLRDSRKGSPGYVSPADARYDTLRKEFADSGQLHLYRGAYHPRGRGIRRAGMVVQAPVRLLVSPLVEAVGTGAWDNMLRRTSTMFRDPSEFEGEHATPVTYSPGTGTVSVLMDSVSALVAADPSRYEVVLIGHSMGTIVLNEVLQQYPDLPVHRIVYMAAACSVRDFLASVVPFMQRHPDTRFYNLTLHPKADANEGNFLGLAPGGSLLEYVDDYLSKPSTYLDQTLGKWDHLVKASHLIPASVRGRVYAKGFGLYDPDLPGYGKRGDKPFKHGDFNDPDVPFWREEFWTPPPPVRR